MRARQGWLGLFILALMMVLALAVRGHRLGDGSLQGDEQIWHERSARLIQQVVAPVAPERLKIPPTYYSNRYVNLFKSRGGYPLLRFYPFNIVMPSLHPGTPISLMIGLSYLFFGEGTGSWSLNLAPVAEVCRYPGVLLGTLWVGLIFLLARRLFGIRTALIASAIAAVEPMLVGYSRLARLDLSVAFFVTAAFYCYLRALQENRCLWAILAGLFTGLGLTTNPYALTLAPAFLLLRLLYPPHPSPPPPGGRGLNSSLEIDASFEEAFNPLPPGGGGLGWGGFKPSRLDTSLLLGSFGFYVLFYPNLWTNVPVGLVQVVCNIFKLPHVQGESGQSHMPVSRLFYLVRAPQHILPWVVGLFAVGGVIGWIKRSREFLAVFLWGVATVVLLSLPAGRKEIKDFLIAMPAVCIVAAYGAQQLIAVFGRIRDRIGAWWTVADRTNPTKPQNGLLANVATGSAIALILAGGLYSTAQWWPYPLLYTWPWSPNPQTTWPVELTGTGEGSREAIAWAIRHSGTPRPVIGSIAAMRILEYYYDSNHLVKIRTVDDLKNADWLLVRPKYTFNATPKHPVVRWIREHRPDYVLKFHQIELIRLYQLKRS